MSHRTDINYWLKKDSNRSLNNLQVKSSQIYVRLTMPVKPEQVKRTRSDQDPNDWLKATLRTYFATLHEPDFNL